MKTIERLDYPVYISRQYGCTRHDSAVIVLTNGAPAFVRAIQPDVVYPWENIRQIGKVVPADEVDTAVTTAEVERLQAEVDRLKQLHHDSCVSLRDALGLTHDNHDHAGLCEQVTRIRAEWDHLRRYTSPGSLARLERELEETKAAMNRSAAHHVETLAKMRGALTDALGQQPSGERDFDNLCKCVAAIREEWAALRAIGFSKPHMVFDQLAKALGLSNDADANLHTLLKRVAAMRADLDSVTEMRNVLKQQLLEIRADLHKPAAPAPAQVDLGGISPVHVVVGFGKQGMHEEAQAKPVADLQAQNRDQWRATCLANGAKDCTVYFGPGDEVTFVVELQPCLRPAKVLGSIQDALLKEHGLRANDYKLREVRPLVDGVKTSHFQF